MCYIKMIDRSLSVGRTVLLSTVIVLSHSNHQFAIKRSVV